MAAGADAALDFRRWAAYAVALDRLPAVGSEVYYFAQGHAEQWPSLPPLQAAHANPMLACTIEAIECFTAGEQPCARISLRPGNHIQENATDTRPDPDSFIYFPKRLSQTDVDRTYFVVPRLCAEYMLPTLAQGTNTQALHIPDLNGKPYNFEHKIDDARMHHQIRGDWSRFLEDNTLHRHDTVVFIRGIDQDVLIESRRRQPIIIPGVQEPIDELRESLHLAAQGGAFTVTFYPGKGSGSPFVVLRGAVDEWMAKQWQAGMKVRMRPRDLVLDSREARGRLEVITGTIRQVIPHLVWRNLEIDLDVPVPAGPSINKNMWEVEPIQNPRPPPPLAKRIQVSTEQQPPPAAKRNKDVDTNLRL